MRINPSLARYLADGQLDASFGTGGIRHTGQYGSPGGAVVAADGTIFVANNSTLYRFRPDGSLDTTTAGFGPSGQLYTNGIYAQSLKLDGTEVYDVAGLGAGLKPQQDLTLRITHADGKVETVPVICRIDTPIEIDYYRHGGILPYVLRQLVAAEK